MSVHSSASFESSTDTSPLCSAVALNESLPSRSHLLNLLLFAALFTASYWDATDFAQTMPFTAMLRPTVSKRHLKCMQGEIFKAVEQIALNFLWMWENKQVSAPERKYPTPPPRLNTNKHTAESFIVSHHWPLCVHFGPPHLAGQSGLDVLCVQPEAVWPPCLMDGSNGAPGGPRGHQRSSGL